MSRVWAERPICSSTMRPEIQRWNFGAHHLRAEKPAEYPHLQIKYGSLAHLTLQHMKHLPLQMKDGFPAALSSSVPKMKKGHCCSTSRQTDPQAFIMTVSLGDSSSKVGVKELLLRCDTVASTRVKYKGILWEQTQNEYASWKKKKQDFCLTILEAHFKCT